MRSVFLIVAVAMSMVPLTALCEDQTGEAACRLMETGQVEEGLKIFEQLAATGDDQAMVQLGIYYYQGEGVERDYAKAMDWFIGAVTNHNADAFVNLGVMHRDGNSVPKNKKIAYCVFLTTHMCGLGSQSTQGRSNSCLRRIIEELSNEEVKDCLSNYTLEYVMAYIEAKGDMEGIPDRYKPSKDNPALRDLDWWLDHELDAIYGEPSKEEKEVRLKRDEQRKREMAGLRHTLVFQIRFPGDTASQYSSCDVITDDSMSGGAVAKKLVKSADYAIYEKEALIYFDEHRFVTVEDSNGKTLVYKIGHPAKPSPQDWSDWFVPGYVLGNSADKLTLLHGEEPKSKTAKIPDNPPELRFKVVKE